MTSSSLACKNIWDLKSNNSTALTSEMESTLKYLREYLKKLQYQQKLKKLKEKGVIDDSGEGDNFDNSFKDNLQLGYFLMTQTRRLLFLEKESKINKLNKPGQIMSLHSGNSITKSLYTIPSIKQSSISSSYVDELQDILYQFNKTLVVKKERPMSLSKSKKSKNPKKKTSETEMVMTIFLREHAAKTNQFLKFNIIPTNNNFEFAYACSLLHLSGKGKARGKNLAKEAAARNLVQLLVDLQQSEILPESISPFTKEEYVSDKN
uniref:DRBM domain-containing protein n=1 Tax=Clastoptera arizonana TaxID=38151 RepID=A0A1B6D4Y3_9HEMI